MPKRWSVALLLLFAFPLPLLVPFDGSDLLLWLITWCPAGIVGLITALLVKSPGKKQAERATRPLRNSLSPRVWIIVSPVLFLVLCMIFEFIDVPDYPDFKEVLVVWFLTSLASLIILLVVKLGSRASAALPNQELLQQAYEQG